MLCFYEQTVAQHINELTNTVMNNFTKSHPHTLNVQWQVRDSNFIATFTENNINIQKTYNYQGKLLKTKIEIDESFLPKSTYDYVAKYRALNKIEKAYKVINENNIFSYLVEINKWSLYFDENGHFVNETSRILDLK